MNQTTRLLLVWKSWRIMQSVCERLSQRHHISFLLNGTPEQTASSRLARLDLRYHSPDSGYVVKGDLGTGKVHYSDAVSINQYEAYPLLKRMQVEGARFCPYLGEAALLDSGRRAVFSEKAAGRFHDGGL